MPDPVLPQRARVVVVGGGVIGCSVAYHLAGEGWTDVLLLERDQLTSGTTWHSAGLIVTFGSTSETSTAMRLYTRDLYARRVPRRPRGELVPLEQQHVGPAGVGQVIRDGAADDAASHYHDAGALGQDRIRHAGQVRGQPAGSRPMAS